MTAAISDASTPFSAACWRMMSSWRSGSWISCTAWSTGCTSARTATTTSASPVARTSRRRSSARRRARLRDEAEGRLERRAVAGWALMASGGQLRKNPRQLLLKFAEAAGIVHSVGRPLGLLLLGELACRALVQRLVPAAPGPLLPDRLVGRDGDRGVVVGLQPRLKEQRRLHHQRPRRRLLLRFDGPPLGDPLAHLRPDQLLE